MSTQYVSLNTPSTDPAAFIWADNVLKSTGNGNESYDTKYSTRVGDTVDRNADEIASQHRPPAGGDVGSDEAFVGVPTPTEPRPTTSTYLTSERPTTTSSITEGGPTVNLENRNTPAGDSAISSEPTSQTSAAISRSADTVDTEALIGQEPKKVREAQAARAREHNQAFDLTTSTPSETGSTISSKPSARTREALAQDPFKVSHVGVIGSQPKQSANGHPIATPLSTDMSERTRTALGSDDALL